MAMNRAFEGTAPTAAEAQLARVAAAGLARHDHLATLSIGNGPSSGRDLTDAVHLLCQIYGRHPGVIELALNQCPGGPVRDWLSAASEAFERERLYLVRLTAALGPMPSTPGHAETEAALMAQRHAVETLARSERSGCALGAATALVADWPSLRILLDRAAERVGMDVPLLSLPDQASVARIVATGVQGMAAERALGFGCEQLLLQNRGLFDLLEARAEAREDL